MGGAREPERARVMRKARDGLWVHPQCVAACYRIVVRRDEAGNRQWVL